MFSIPWYFASIVDQAELFGKVLQVPPLSACAWSVFAGTLIDRYSRKNIFLIASIVGLLVLTAAGYYGHVNQEMPIGLVAAIFVFTFFGFNIHYHATFIFYSEKMAAKGQYGKVNLTIGDKAPT